MVKALDDQPNLSPPIPMLRWKQDYAGFSYSYDKGRDVLFIHETPKRPAVSLDVAGYVWIRFDPETGEVVGVEIEDFEKVFLVKFPEMAVGWEQVKPAILKRFKKHDRFSDYLSLLMNYIKSILEHRPPQLAFR